MSAFSVASSVFQRGEFGLYLFVGFLTDRIALEQGILAEHTVFGQRHLGFQSVQLSLKLAVVHLGQQLSLAHEGTFGKEDIHYFSRSFERRLLLFHFGQFVVGSRYEGMDGQSDQADTNQCDDSPFDSFIHVFFRYR